MPEDPRAAAWSTYWDRAPREDDKAVWHFGDMSRDVRKTEFMIGALVYVYMRPVFAKKMTGVRCEHHMSDVIPLTP